MQRASGASEDFAYGTYDQFFFDGSTTYPKLTITFDYKPTGGAHPAGVSFRAALRRSLVSARPSPRVAQSHAAAQRSRALEA